MFKTKETKLVGAKEHNLVCVQFLDVSLVKKLALPAQCVQVTLSLLICFASCCLVFGPAKHLK